MNVVLNAVRSREVPHNRLTFGETEVDAVVRTVRSGQWAQGPRVAELEDALARMAKVKYCVCVASGVSGLRLALGALGISRGDAVRIPGYCCVALANACLSWDAQPVAVDIEDQSWNLDPNRCLNSVTRERTKAIIAVNTFGAPADLSFRGNCEIPVIEDCAHAFGFETECGPLGGRSEIGILSFYATKLLGGGEGGAVLTDSSSVFEFVKNARDYSDQGASGYRLNDKMNDLEASLVLAQLERLPEMLEKREKLAWRYIDLLSSGGETGFRLPRADKNRVWYRFALELLDEKAEVVAREMCQQGAAAAVPVSDWRSPGDASCPTADRAYRSVLSLPLYPSLTEEEQDYVVETFLKLSQEKRRA